jgi:protein arginine kinase activator
MKCQKCDKTATIHITEITGGVPEEVHLCEAHAREYLSQGQAAQQSAPASLASSLAQQIVSSTAEELSRIDQQACPICGMTFYDFRSKGRLGCAHDYVFFERQLEPLLLNIHGETRHMGKRPKAAPREAYYQQQLTELIRMRREMKQAVEAEDYERASELRDRIRTIERASDEKRRGAT